MTNVIWSRLRAGHLILGHVTSDLGKGWLARGELDYHIFHFRQQYTESFNEAVYSQTHSVGFLTKHWSDFGINLVAQNNVNFLSTTPGNDISIRKFPELEFNQREHQVDAGRLPFWISFDSSAGLLRRSQNLFQTRQFVDRLDFAPRITTALHLPGFQIVRVSEFAKHPMSPASSAQASSQGRIYCEAPVTLA